MPPWAKQRPILNRITSPRPGAVDQARAGEEEAEIALVVAVQHPIAGVRLRVERLDKPEVAIDADKQHRAVDADALDVSRVMVGRADPAARRGDDRVALKALAGVAIENPLRLARGPPRLAPGEARKAERPPALMRGTGRGAASSIRHLRRRDVGEAAEVRHVVEPALTGRLRVIAARIDREGVAGATARTAADT